VDESEELPLMELIENIKELKPEEGAIYEGIIKKLREQLKPVDFRALELLLEGRGYEEISKELGFKSFSVVHFIKERIVKVLREILAEEKRVR
jgi:hypothetical protein